jgi:hypothetical protein
MVFDRTGEREFGLLLFSILARKRSRRTSQYAEPEDQYMAKTSEEFQAKMCLFYQERKGIMFAQAN